MQFPESLAFNISVPGDDFYLRAIGDEHVGSKGCAAEAIRRDVDETIAARGGAILMGDAVEAIHVDDKRFDCLGIRPDAPAEEGDLADLVPTQFRAASTLLAPLRGRILGALLGNHELTYIRKAGALSLYTCDDPKAPGFCERLNCAPFGYSARLDVSIWFGDEKGRRRKSGRNPDQIVRFGAHHGAGGAITPGGKLNRALAWGGIWQDCDVILWAHSHAMTDWIQPRLLKGRGCARDHQYHVVLTGGYNRAYYPSITPGYAERGAYPPTAIGSPVVRCLSNGRTRVEIST